MRKINSIIGAMALLACWALTATAQSTLPAITPAQIEKFKQLPRAQQEALASQYGIDLNALQNSSSQQSAQQQSIQQQSIQQQATQQSANSPTPIAPRPTTSIAAATTQDQQTDAQALKPYGYDLFAGAPTTFEPMTDIPVPTNYMLGPGDTLNIQLFGKESASYALVVNRDGSIQLPDLGPLNVAGSSIEAVRAMIAQKIQKEKIGVTANITLGELRSIRVFVLGEAYQSGSYSVSSLSTITNALYFAGGIKEGGSLRNIQLKRRGKLVRTLDLYDLLMRGDTSNDVQLQPGDAIFIPQVGARVGVDGEVQRPAIYELKAHESINDVIAMAGGIKPEAYPSASVIERFDSRHVRTLVNVDLTSARDQQMRVRRGDLIEVRSTAAHVDNAIALIGAANRPGLYQWRDGMRVSDILHSRSNDLHENSDLDYALIIRETDKRGDIAALQFNVGNAIADPAGTDNLVLQPHDRIMVFQRFEFDTSREAFLNDLLQKKAEGAQEQTANQQSTEASLDSSATVDQGQASVLSSELIEKIKTQQLQIQRSTYQLAEKGLAAYNDPKFLDQTRLFTRKQLLSPVIAQLREQGKAGAPIRIAEIAGAVKFPGEYPIAENGSVKDLIIAAGGLIDSAYTESVELTRFNAGAGAADSDVEHQQLHLADVLGANSAGYALQSRDQLNVMTEPNYQEQMTVTLKGEVQFPGTYTIRRGETFSEVLKRAGGLTRFAFARGTVFTRERLKEEERKHFASLAQDLRKEVAARSISAHNIAPVSYDEESKLLNDLANFQPVGRMVVNVPDIIAGNGKEDFQLENNDVIVVPSARQQVSVIGEVQHAISHRYIAGLSASDYIERSGGVKARGDAARTYVIKADGSVVVAGKSSWFSRGSEIDAGDTIVVPLDTNYSDGLTTWTQITQIMFQTAVAIAAVAHI